MATSCLLMPGDTSASNPCTRFDDVTRSSVVQKVLLEAWADGTRFSVIVVDSRPMLEGIRIHARSLSRTETP